MHGVHNVNHSQQLSKSMSRNTSACPCKRERRYEIGILHMQIDGNLYLYMILVIL